MTDIYIQNVNIGIKIIWHVTTTYNYLKISQSNHGTVIMITENYVTKCYAYVQFNVKYITVYKGKNKRAKNKNI